MPDGEKGTHTEAFHLQFCSATYLSQFNSDFDAAKTKISLKKHYNQNRYFEGTTLITLG